MTCPECNGRVKVLDVVHVTTDNETYRKKKCCDCGFEFYTTEFVVEPDVTFRKLWTEYNRTNSKNRK